MNSDFPWEPAISGHDPDVPLLGYGGLEDEDKKMWCELAAGPWRGMVLSCATAFPGGIPLAIVY